MVEGREARLWRILGIAFILGGGVPLALAMLNWVTVSPADPDTVKLGLWCGFTVVLGIAAMAAGRVFTVLHDRSARRRDLPWTILAFSGMPAGALVLAVERQRTLNLAATSSQQAVLLAGLLLFVAGVAAVVSERIVRHANLQTQYRVARGLQNAEAAARLVRVH
jgi:hypothetical protein